jgi:hypothetical protein
VYVIPKDIRSSLPRSSRRHSRSPWSDRRSSGALIAARTRTEQPPYQVIIFTYLFDDEIARLRESGITLQTPETPERRHFLELVKPHEPPVAPADDDAAADEPPAAAAS